jgi:hypothetical protein
MLGVKLKIPEGASKTQQPEAPDAFSGQVCMIKLHICLER